MDFLKSLAAAAASAALLTAVSRAASDVYDEIKKKLGD